jgi:hypothetical protein
MNTETRCECPDTGGIGLGLSWYEPQEYKALNHPKGVCPGDFGIRLYERKGQRLWLCSCCNLNSDQAIELPGVSW